MPTLDTSQQKAPGGAQQAEASPWLKLLENPAGAPQFCDLTRVLQQLLTLVHRTAPQHAAGSFLLDDETRAVQGQVTDLFDPDLNVGAGALQEALRNPAAYVISVLGGVRRDEDATFRSQIVVPFRASPRVRGALVLRSKQPGAFCDKDGEALSAFARRASGMIENALMHQKVVEEASSEVERDLVMAQEIMARLLPREAPRIPGFDVGSIYIPAKVVGGDLLDYIVRPDDHFGFMIADASGHGIPSALLMTGFRALFRGLIQSDFNMRSVFRNVNQQLVESTAPHQFVSAVYAALDAVTGRMIYVNGGHVPPLLIRPGQPARKLDVGGPVLGVLSSASYHEDSLVLHAKDILVAYSDGLSEAESPKGEAFGEEHIIEVVERNRELSADAICRALREAATDLSGSVMPDDLTILVVKYL